MSYYWAVFLYDYVLPFSVADLVGYSFTVTHLLTSSQALAAI